MDEGSSQAYKQGYDFFITDSTDRSLWDGTGDWHRGFADAFHDWKLENDLHYAGDPPLDLANNLY